MAGKVGMVIKIFKALERHTRKIKVVVGLLFLVKLSPDPILRPHLALELAQANCARVFQANSPCAPALALAHSP